MLVFCFDMGLVIMFFKVFEKIEIEVLYILYKKNNIFLKICISIISQMFTILKLLNIFCQVRRINNFIHRS